ncbi:HlyD family secretion protein [Labrys sp. KB_33_2]|uniref:HlyD family secretion protein n=1 Tax=Labrys sp. KB_33_2 TaxID=3237479 RepID=UPI003F903D9B
MSLFRQEAFAHARQLDFGAPVASKPVAWTILVWFLLLFGVTVALFLCFAKFARKETATGILNFSRGELRVLAPRAGTVRELFVTEGKTVNAGDRLAWISTEQQLTGGGVADENIMQAIGREQQALEAKLRVLDIAAPLDIRAKTERIKGLRNQIAALNEVLPIRAQRLELSRGAAEQGRLAADRGYMSGDNLRQRIYDHLNQEQSVNELKSQIAQLQSQVAEEESALAMLPSTTERTRADIERDLATLDERRANTQAQSGYLLRAPAAGTVTALQARTGERVDPNKPLMAVVPNGSALQAEIYVSSRAIGFTQVGQPVHLLYDAFPHERFGFATGRISDIATTVLKPEEATAAISLKEPAYRVIVTPDNDTIMAYGRRYPLRSGMALTADIVLDKRSFLSLLLDPLLASSNRILVN